MPYYKGTYYKSKAACIRAMYDAGDVTTSPEDKKRVAALWCMTVQTVHATLVKHLGKKAPKVTKVYKKHPTMPKPQRTRAVATGNRFETSQLIGDAFTKCYDVAREKGRDLPEIEIRYDLKGTVAGQFCTKYGKMYFRVNLELAHLNIDDYLKQTVPHEFCHYIQRMDDLKNYRRSRPHGNEWKRKMVYYFNLEPNRCHSYDVSPVKQRRQTVPYKCNCRTHDIGIVRHRNIVRYGKTFTCRLCRSQLRIV